MVKIIAVHTRDLRVYGWEDDRTASFLQQFSLKFLKSSSEMKLEVHQLLRSCLSCSILNNLCSAGENASLTWEVHGLAESAPHAHRATVCSFEMSTDMLLTLQ